MSKPRIIAFYLPQFHPIPENDEWWGKGFTEWTNVGKAKSLFPGHKQPVVPADLGYYDLRVPDVYDEQTKLAREAGVEGFCFWHYYFGDGKQLLEKPLQRIVKESKNEFPFCLGWANESWEKKQWNKDGHGNKILIEQKYNGIEDCKKHFEIILPLLKDSRYIKVDEKPLFFVYNPKTIPDTKLFIECWQKLAEENGLKGIYFVAQAKWGNRNKKIYLQQGYDAVYSNEVQDGAALKQNNPFTTIKFILFKFLGFPRIVSFKKIIKYCTSHFDYEENIFPGIICGWDHTPRSGKKGMVITNFTKALFKKHIMKVFACVKDKSDEHKIIFLKSWNEWGEGNFMEPDLQNGHMKLETLKECLNEWNK